MNTLLELSFNRLTAWSRSTPAGTIAVITTTPGLINTRLKRDPQRPNVKVLGVNQARGLEFDGGVIVVEPADFPHNDRRQGPLYTALTRPNRELVVVHTKVLPLELQSGPRAAVRPPTATNKPTRAATPRRRAKSYEAQASTFTKARQVGTWSAWCARPDPPLERLASEAQKPPHDERRAPTADSPSAASTPPQSAHPHEFRSARGGRECCRFRELTRSFAAASPSRDQPAGNNL